MKQKRPTRQNKAGSEMDTKSRNLTYHTNTINDARQCSGSEVYK